MKPRYSFSSRRTRNIDNLRKQKQKYPELTKKIIEDSDILLQVLDARFMEETRNKEVEEILKKKKKKIIYVINKADLIDKNQKQNLYPYVFVSCTQRKGIRELRDLIKRNAKKLKKEDDRVNVGIIGYPNTGKSSLINLLIGKNSAKTAAEAGFTKGLQKLKLSPGILLIDSPGIIPEAGYSAVNRAAITQHTKLGGRSYSQVKEPELVVSDLIMEFPNIFETFYNIDSESNPEIFIEKLGKKKGFLKKGGEVDEDKTARSILRDWQEGKIRIS
ncbi:MAG: GTPase [Nanoarchaeota archaeon]